MTNVGERNQEKFSNFSIRIANEEDKEALEKLIFEGDFVHRHLDWRPPLDWLGQNEFQVFERGGKIIGTLVCPEHLSKVAWIRLFAVLDEITMKEVWESLWLEMKRILQIKGVKLVVCLVLQYWFTQFLESSGFREFNRVTSLILNIKETFSPLMVEGYSLHTMKEEEIYQVFEVDQASFIPIWQNSLDDLRIAYQLASSATVIKHLDSIVGYQISTATQIGMHLARLAVDPLHRGRGVGKWLVGELIRNAFYKHISIITVNTQEDNYQSLKIYQKAGFMFNGEVYPVYFINLTS
jgi:ribosomal protein S18 acetylase RimI-like enzyme